MIKKGIEKIKENYYNIADTIEKMWIFVDIKSIFLYNTGVFLAKKVAHAL